MIPTLETKQGFLIQPQAIADDAYWAGSHQHGSTNTSVDTAEWDFISIYFELGATDIAVAELSLYDSADNSTFTIISASNYSSSLPSATADNTAVAWHIPLNSGNYKRYIRVNAKAGNGAAGSYAVCYYHLSRGVNKPNTLAERGLANEIFL